MIQVKCTNKFRDAAGKIYGYRLIDLNGKTQDVESDKLKQAIASNSINVINLRLTSDNRLVDTNTKLLKQKNLGDAPVKSEDSVDKLKSAVEVILNRYTDKMGMGDSFSNCTTCINTSNGIELTTMVMGVYYDRYGEMYCTSFSLNYNKDKKNACAYTQRGMLGEDVVADGVTLSSPLLSKENMKAMDDMMTRMYQAFVRWRDRSKR